MLRLDDPLDEIQKEITVNEVMEKSINFAPGLRLVKDPFFPCLISFITSIQKNIPSITTLTQSLRENFGSKYDFRGKTYYAMPTPEQLDQATVKDLRGLSFGYRSEFIKRTTESILSQNINAGLLRGLDFEGARDFLKGLHGVGDKVADCVCLFSLGFLEAFPIDVWIERVIQQ